MELDDFKEAWNQMNARLQAQEELVSRNIKIGRVRSLMLMFAGLPIFELVGGLVAASMLGTYLEHGSNAMRFIVPGAVLLLFNLFTIVFNARQLVAAFRIDYSRPVAEVQLRLAEMRTERVRYVQGLLLVSPLLWVPLLIVCASGFFGVDVYESTSTAWLAANLLFGIAVIPLGLWLSAFFGPRLSPQLRAVVDSLAGRSLSRAVAELDDIAGFAAG